MVGRRYIVTAFFFLCIGGLAAVLMRLQLARPENRLIGPDLYNQLFTMHGTTMMFLFAVPVMDAFAIYLVPLMVGTRNIAFPRHNAFSYWVYLLAVLVLVASYFVPGGPTGAGWTLYPPQAILEGTPSARFGAHGSRRDSLQIEKCEKIPKSSMARAAN